MDIEFSENPTFYVSDKWRFIYETLCRRGRSGDTYYVFEQMTGLFTLCSAIGFINQERFSLEKRKDIFKWSSLENENEVPLLTSIAWETSNRNTAILSDRKQIADICVEFAEGGIKYLFDQFFEDHVQDGQIVNPQNLGIEFSLAQIIEGLRQKDCLFT